METAAGTRVAMGTRKDDESAGVKCLTKNTRQMKFMQRRNKNLSLEVEYVPPIDETHWVIEGAESRVKRESVKFDSSYIRCEELLPVGRMSFLGYNTTTEKLYAELLEREQSKISGEREAADGISDNEMAERYESLVDTIAKKYQANKKRRRATEAITEKISSSTDEDEEEAPAQSAGKKAKLKFMKPADD